MADTITVGKKYKKWILELRIVLENLGYNSIGFILCSDEKPPESLLNEKDTHYTEGKHYMVDLHTLTLCDYNIGPPSSFGTWISWYGNVLRLIIDKDTTIENLDNFSISNSC